MPEVGQSKDFDQIRAEVGGLTTRKVLDMLQNQDFKGSIRSRLGKAASTIDYHIEKLEKRGLIEETREEDGKVFYKITEKGEKVLEGMNIPEY